MKVNGLMKNIGMHSLYIDNYTEEIKSQVCSAMSEQMKTEFTHLGEPFLYQLHDHVNKEHCSSLIT